MEAEQYFISVGEPWNFESQDGPNIIKGKILEIKSDDCLVFMSNKPVIFGPNSGCLLILTPRHKGNDFSDLGREIVVVNGSLLMTDYNPGLDKKELLNNSKLEIVGSLRQN